MVKATHFLNFDCYENLRTTNLIKIIDYFKKRQLFEDTEFSMIYIILIRCSFCSILSSLFSYKIMHIRAIHVVS